MYLEKNMAKIDLIMAKNIFLRFKGFMFKRNIDYALCFPRCNSIHTFFMKENIDVYMTDRDFKILYVYKELSKNKIILPKPKVYYTFELPINKIDYKVNEKIKIKD